MHYNLYLSSEKKIKFEIASDGLSGKRGNGPRVSLEEITKREFEDARREAKALRDAAFKINQFKPLKYSSIILPDLSGLAGFDGLSGSDRYKH